MPLQEILQSIAFGLLAFIAIAGAIGMTTTMSMFRSGIFLMASFIGVAGLFILLAADLMGLLQVMMYIGGMLVMILFMVLFMMDPGGAMMAAMPDMLSPIERLFSAGLQQDGTNAHVPAQSGMHASEKNMDMGGTHAGMKMDDMSKDMSMDSMDMSMVTPVRTIAVWIASLIAVGLVILIVSRSNWHVVGLRPDPDSARAVGTLLLGKYMAGFEGAGFLILLGIFGAVFMAHARSGKSTPIEGGRTASVKALAAVGSEEIDIDMPPSTRQTMTGTDSPPSAAHAHEPNGSAS